MKGQTVIESDLTASGEGWFVLNGNGFDLDFNGLSSGFPTNNNTIKYIINNVGLMDGDTVVNSLHGISGGLLFDNTSDVTINNSVIYGNSGAVGSDGFMIVVGKTTLKDSYFINNSTAGYTGIFTFL